MLRMRAFLGACAEPHAFLNRALRLILIISASSLLGTWNSIAQTPDAAVPRSVQQQKDLARILDRQLKYQFEIDKLERDVNFQIDDQKWPQVLATLERLMFLRGQIDQLQQQADKLDPPKQEDKLDPLAAAMLTLRKFAHPCDYLAEYYKKFGLAHHNLEHYDEAIQNYKLALNCYANDDYGKATAGYDLVKLGHFADVSQLLAGVLFKLARYDEAESALRVALDRMDSEKSAKIAPDEHGVISYPEKDRTYSILTLLGVLLWVEHRDPEAESLFGRAYVIATTKNTQDRISAGRLLADTYLRRGLFSNAELLLRDSLSKLMATANSNASVIVNTHVYLANALIDGGKASEAAAILKNAIAINDSQPPNEYSYGARFALSRIYVRTGKYQQAEELLDEMASRLANHENEKPVDAVQVRIARAELFIRASRLGDAEKELGAAFEVIDKLNRSDFVAEFRHNELLPDVWAARARYFEYGHRSAEALDAIRKAAGLSGVLAIDQVSGKDLLREMDTGKRWILGRFLSIASTRETSATIDAVVVDESFRIAQQLANREVADALVQMATRYLETDKRFAENVREVQDVKNDVAREGWLFSPPEYVQAERGR